MKLISFINGLFCLLSFSAVGQHTHQADLQTTIDAYLTKAMKTHAIPGMAVAVIQKDQLLYETYLGLTSIKEQQPVTDETIFRVFSSSKLITATAIFQLVESGALSLDDVLPAYFGKLPQHWQAISIRNLLTHSSGLPDMVRSDNSLTDAEMMTALSKAEMDFEPGNEFRYNQTNYWLLAQIIEQISGHSFEAFVLENQFDAGTTTRFSSNSNESIPNRSLKYNFNEQKNDFDVDQRNDGRRAHSGNGLNISLSEFIEWNKKLDKNELLKQQTKNQMWNPFAYKNGQDEFQHGWGKYRMNDLVSYGFSGGNVSGFRKFVSEDLTIIFLSNGYAYAAYDMIVNDLARLTLATKNASQAILEADVFKLLADQKYPQATKAYQRLLEENPKADLSNLKWTINKLGNRLLAQKQFDQAIESYRANATLYPDWWVSFVGIAEGYEGKKALSKSLENYQKGLALNKTNEYNYNKNLEAKISELTTAK